MTPPADTTRTALGFDAFSPSPLASMAVDLTPPQTSYAGTVPAEYVSPDQTLSGPAPMSGMSTMAGLAAPMGLGFDLAALAPSEKPADSTPGAAPPAVTFTEEGGLRLTYGHAMIEPRNPWREAPPTAADVARRTGIEADGRALPLAELLR